MADKSLQRFMHNLLARTDILGAHRLSPKMIAVIAVVTLCVCFCVSWVFVVDTGKHFERATGLLAEDRFDEALEEYTIVVNRDPKAVLAWCGCGLCQLNIDKPDDALESYETALKIENDSVDALIGKSICLSELGRKKESKWILTRLLEHDPGNNRVHSLIRSLELDL